jgi:predicted RNA binding protein YcfA (HicA-like mRNA interferase family)
MAPGLPVLNGREVIRVFESLGWKEARQSGSHIFMIKDGHIATLSVLDHREVAKGTLRSLIRLAGLTVLEFVSRIRSMWKPEPANGLGFEDYLEEERDSSSHHEYVYGHIYARGVVSELHDARAADSFEAVHSKLPLSCRAWQADMKAMENEDVILSEEESTEIEAIRERLACGDESDFVDWEDIKDRL